MKNEQKLHIAIIPDGNRRWAKTHALHPWDGHKKAIENFRLLTEWCHDDPRVSVLTIWCFSTENWKRDKREVDMLMQLLEVHLQKERALLEKNNTRFVHSGRKDRIPAQLAKLIEDVEEESKNRTASTLHLAIDYGGKDELLRAMQKMATSERANERTNNTIAENIFCSFLDHPELPDIDLIVRTSGEKRTSNFFLWQSAYSEWSFVEKKFPDFTAEDLANEVDAFMTRSRRFGG